MLDRTEHAPEAATEILGDLTALASQLGGTDGLEDLSLAAASVGSPPIRSLAELEQFLGDYASRTLIARELPAVARAYLHASRGEARELIALDQEVGRVPAAESFSRASSWVGRTQLRRLRPLRTERVVQRYLKAVETGEAKAWHTLVFGLVLALYSLPLRQGLTHFAQQTLGGFVDAASERFRLLPSARDELVQARVPEIQAAVSSIVEAQDPLAAERSNLGLPSGQPAT
jgi:urease accessory protein UreF